MPDPGLYVKNPFQFFFWENEAKTAVFGSKIGELCPKRSKRRSFGGIIGQTWLGKVQDFGFGESAPTVLKPRSNTHLSPTPRSYHKVPSSTIQPALTPASKSL